MTFPPQIPYFHLTPEIKVSFCLYVDHVGILSSFQQYLDDSGYKRH